jgi:hypothetical protein
MARYRDSATAGLNKAACIYIEVLPIGLVLPITAMIDTGAPWCILEPQFGEQIKDFLEVVESEVWLDTRLGRVRGGLYRGALMIPALEGEPLEVNATFFLSSDWYGGNFIGYEGLLQHIRFAVDPRDNAFFFGPT